MRITCQISSKCGDFMHIYTSYQQYYRKKRLTLKIKKNEIK